MRLLLVRHGLTVWNAERRLQGHADIELTDTGREQARALAPIIARIGYNAAITSDLVRARETAQLLGVENPRTEIGLRERNAGSWTGLKIDDLKTTDPSAWHAWHRGEYAPPMAEAWDGFSTRVLDAVARQMAEQCSSLLIVCHGGVIRTVLCHLLGLGADRLTSVAHASLTSVRYGEAGLALKLELFNYRPGTPNLDTPE